MTAISDGLERALVAGLTGDSPPVLDLPLWAQEAPQDAVPPYVVFSIVSGEDWQHLDGAAGVTQSRVQMDCYHLTYDGMAALARAVRRAMLSLGNPDPLAVIQGVTLANRVDFREGETDPRLYRRSLDFFVTHNEE